MTTLEQIFQTQTRSPKHASDCPVWFLDIDGVINAFPNAATISTQEFAQYSTIKASPNRWPGMSDDDYHAAYAEPGGLRRYTITYRYDQVIAKINELHHSGRVRVVWCTTWGRGANGEFAHRVGIKGPFTSVGEPPPGAWTGAHSETWWKSEAITAYLEKHPEVRRIVWTDDDHSAWDTAHVVEGREALVICPDPATGLTDEDMKRIEEFLRE